MMPMPTTGDSIPLTLIMIDFEQFKDKWWNLWRSQVIWSLVPMSIMESLFPIKLGNLKRELDIPILARNPITVRVLLFEFESSILRLKDKRDVILPFLY